MEAVLEVKVKGDINVILTDNVWNKISRNHPEAARYFDKFENTLKKPDKILTGYGGATKAALNLGKNKWLVIIWKEVGKNKGRIKTVYITKRL